MRLAALGRRLGLPRGAVYLPIEEAERRGLLDSIPVGLRASSAHFVLPSGEVLSAGRAMAGVLAATPGGSMWSKLFWGSPSRERLAERLYVIGAGQRRWLTRLLPAPRRR